MRGGGYGGGGGDGECGLKIVVVKKFIMNLNGKTTIKLTKEGKKSISTSFYLLLFLMEHCKRGVDCCVEF